HGFGGGGKNGAECEIAGADAMRARQLVVAVIADTQTQTGASNGVEISRIQILLTEMHPISTVADRQFPVIVDEKPRTVLSTQLHGTGDLSLQLGGIDILHPQLNRAYTQRQQPRDPLHRIDHRIKSELATAAG